MAEVNTPNASQRLWVFGYGSLCWQPGFQFGKRVLGHVKGYARRFWQGNTAHRGTPDKPGRVATLVEDDEAVTWGIAFELVGNAALEYLQTRECKLGGYQTIFTEFYPRHNVAAHYPALLYVATSNNCHWLGPAPLPDIATQVTECLGPAGHNVEYVCKLADFQRTYLPETYDEHLFTLEALVLQHVKDKQLALKDLMGEPVKPFVPDLLPSSFAILQEPRENNNQEEPHVPEPRRDSFQYQSRIPPKKLRCLNV